MPKANLKMISWGTTFIFGDHLVAGEIGRRRWRCRLLQYIIEELPASTSVAVRRPFSTANARAGMQLLPRTHHKQELDVQKLRPRPYLAEPATMSSFSSSRHRRAPPLRRQFLRVCFAPTQFISQLASPRPCASSEPASTIPLHRRCPHVVIFLGDIRSAAVSPLVVGSPLWHISFLSALCFGFALVPWSWSAHRFCHSSTGHTGTPSSSPVRVVGSAVTACSVVCSVPASTVWSSKSRWAPWTCRSP
jgi:hypothetical protein